MAQTTILNLDTETLANLKSSGYTVVSVNGKTYKMALKDITDVTDAKAEASALTAEVTRATAAEATKANADSVYTKTETDTLLTAKVDEAPKDGNIYARKNGAWATFDESKDGAIFNILTTENPYGRNIFKRTTYTSGKNMFSIGHGITNKIINFSDFQNFEIGVTLIPTNLENSTPKALFASTTENRYSPQIQLFSNRATILFPSEDFSYWSIDVQFYNKENANFDTTCWNFFKLKKNTEKNTLELYHEDENTELYMMGSISIGEINPIFPNTNFSFAQNYNGGLGTAGYYDFKRTYIKNNGVLIWGNDSGKFDI